MPILIGQGRQAIYDEISDGGSPVYQLANGNSHVERTFRVGWADRDVFTQLALGFPRIANQFAADPADPFRTYVSRVTPLAITDLLSPQDGKPWLYANTVVRMEGVGPLGIQGFDGVPLFKFAMVTLGFESLTWKVLEDNQMPLRVFPIGPVIAPTAVDESSMKRYVTRTRKPSVEYLNLGRGNRKWVDLILPPVEHEVYADGYAVPVPAVELQWTWHQVPFTPEASHKYLGCVNRFPVTETDAPQELSVTYPAGTLLLVGADIRPYRTGSGVFVQDICYRLKYFNPVNKSDAPRGHQFFLKFSGNRQQPERLKLTHNGHNDSLVIPAGNVGDIYANPVPAGDGVPVFQYADFTYLFTLYAPDPTKS